MKRQHPENPNLFWCPKCKQYKDRNKFYPKKTGRTPVGGYCKKCSNKRSLSDYKPRPLYKTKCRVCGKEFEHKNIRRQYCSSKCWEKDRPKRNMSYYQKRNPIKTIIKVCKYCNEKFSITIGYGSHQRRRKYCSKECRDKAGRLREYNYICIICGASFKTSHHNIKTCSSKCKHKLLFGEKKTIICPICNRSRKVYEKQRMVKNKQRLICNSCRSVKWISEYRKEHGDPTLKQRNKKKVIEITDGYVRGQLKNQLKIDDNRIITKEMIELKRLAIKNRRTLNEFIKWREEKENESSNEDVYGKQCSDEKDYEGKLQLSGNCSGST